MHAVYEKYGVIVFWRRTWDSLLGSCEALSYDGSAIDTSSAWWMPELSYQINSWSFVRESCTS